MTKDLERKLLLLENSGFHYNFEREIYINRVTKKVFSLEFVEDNSERDLQAIMNKAGSDRWTFGFNQPPSPSVQEQLETLLG
jgi:hypothetical protein